MGNIWLVNFATVRRQSCNFKTRDQIKT